MKRIAIKNICEVYDGPHATPKKTETGPVYLGIDAITEDGMLDSSQFSYLSKEDYIKWTKRVVPQENDIVFSYEATLGKYALIPRGFYGCLGRRLAIIRVISEEIDAKWLYYYFRSPEWNAFIKNQTVKGSTVDRISVEEFPNYTIPVISLKNQKKMVAVLEKIDAKIRTNNKINDYFNYTHPYGRWKDTGIRLEGDAVQSLTVTFLEMWNAVSDKDANDSDFSKYLFHYDYAAQQTGFVQPYADSPMDNEQVGEEVYISMINKAEKYCWFMTPYLIITDEMTHALCLAAKRGVDVRIITPGIPDKKFIYNVTRSFYHGLVKHGVRVYEWTPGFCHAKMSVADDCMATCGTINLDYRSLYHHFENGCFMADCQAVVEIKNDLIRTMGECRDVTDQYQTGRSAYLRLGQLFMRLFAGLL